MTSSQELMVKNVGHSGIMQMSNVYEQWPFSFPQYHYIRGTTLKGACLAFWRWALRSFIFQLWVQQDTCSRFLPVFCFFGTFFLALVST